MFNICKKNKKIKSLLLVVPFIGSCLFSCNNNSEKYDITWVNYDGTVLGTEKVTKGSKPEYKLSKPTKPGTKEVDYNFTGWSPYITPAYDDTVYTATFAETSKKYKVSFYNNDAKTELLDEISVNYGEIPSYSKKPTKAKDAQYSYTFTGWDKPFYPVTGNQEYVAKYVATTNKYTVTFKNYDGDILETQQGLSYGDPVNYKGTTPTRNKDAQYTYTFTGWSPEVKPATCDATYTAQYGTTTRKYTLNVYSGGGGTGELIGVGTEFDYGTHCVVKATPNTGYNFDGWYDEYDEKIEGASEVYGFDLKEDRKLTAKFTKKKYDITILPSPAEWGEVTATQSKGLVYDQQITLTATPIGSHVFLGFYDEKDQLISSTSPYQYTVKQSTNITAKFGIDGRFETCSWDYVANACNKLEEAEFSDDAIDRFCASFIVNGGYAHELEDFIGATRTVRVNNQDHTVRVIGVKHDKNKNGKYIALTFEFANLISDFDGYSLGYIWADQKTNHDYPNAAVRYALNKIGACDTRKQILACMKGRNDFDTEFYNRSIYEMFPSELKPLLKETRKTVGLYNDGSYNETSYDDKLFMLSGVEMGYSESGDKGFGSTYAYYSNPETAITVKPQVKYNDHCEDIITIDISKGLKYSNIDSYAGYCIPGGCYWIRSPIDNSDKACFIDADGNIDTATINTKGFGLAPAFCI